MRLNRRDFLASASAAAGVALATGLPALAQGANFNATACQPTNSANYAPHFIAVAKGFTKEEGLDLELLTTNSGAKVREILGAGQVQFAMGDSVHPVFLTNRGRPAKILLAIDDRSALANIVMRTDLVNAGVDSLQKLAERKRPDGSKPVIAVASLGGGQHIYLSYLADKLGIGDRFVWLAGGAPQSMLAGLSTGEYDAIAAMPNWLLDAEAKGWGKTVFDVRQNEVWNEAYGGPVPSTVAFALQSTIDDDPEMVQAYVNSVYRALQWMKTASEEEVYEAIGPTYLKDFPVEVAKAELSFYKPITAFSGVVDEQQFKNAAPIWFQNMTEMDPLTFEQVVEPRFIQSAIEKYGS